MNHIYGSEIKVKAHIGSNLYKAVEESFKVSNLFGCVVILEFNDKEIACDFRNGNVESSIKTYFE